MTFRFVLRGHRELSVTRTILGPRLNVDANLRRIRRPMGMGTTQTMTTMIDTGMDYRDNPY